MSDAPAGVISTRPATSRKASEPPAVAAGTSSVTLTSVSPWAGTRTEVLPKCKVCGLPDAAACASLKIASDEPWLRREISFVLRNLSLNSAKPKLRDVPNLLPSVLATTRVAAEPAGWTKPVPPRLVL